MTPIFDVIQGSSHASIGGAWWIPLLDAGFRVQHIVGWPAAYMSFAPPSGQLNGIFPRGGQVFSGQAKALSVFLEKHPDQPNKLSWTMDRTFISRIYRNLLHRIMRPLIASGVRLESMGERSGPDILPLATGIDILLRYPFSSLGSWYTLLDKVKAAGVLRSRVDGYHVLDGLPFGRRMLYVACGTCICPRSDARQGFIGFIARKCKSQVREHLIELTQAVLAGGGEVVFDKT
jgi:hypothetical protein